MRSLGWTFLVLVALAVGCTGGVDQDELGKNIAPVEIRFTEVAEEVGLVFESITREGTLDYISESTGTGVAWLDYDGDGDWDLYAVTGKGRPNALFRNDGGQFTNVAAEAGVDHRGWGMGVAAADFDGDGHTDLFVTNFGEPDVLYRNRGDGTFEDVTARAGVGGSPKAWSTSAAWGDIDGDLDLDLYVARYIDFSDPNAGIDDVQTERNEPITLIPDPYPPQANVLYRNNGDGTFTDVTESARVADRAGKGLGVVFGDLDNDGDLDLYVANDVTPNRLYRNEGDGTFRDISFEAGVDDSRNGMGLDFGDVDDDGDLDLLSTHWQTQTNVLYRSNVVRLDGKRTSFSFDDVTLEAGLGHTSIGLTGWGAQFADFDRDGDLDIFITNGYTSPSNEDPYRCIGQRDQVFRNDGGRFTELKEAFTFTDWGSGRGTAIADFDEDGDLDVAVAQNNGRLLLFRNDTHTVHGWVKVRAPIGARIEAEVGSMRFLREIKAGSSYLSTSAPEALIGVVADRIVDRITVRFTDGTGQSVEQVPVRSRVVFAKGRPPQIEAEVPR